MQKQTKTILIAALVFVILIGAAVAVYTIYEPEIFTGEKVITVLVKEGNETKKEIEIKTDAEYLLGALNEKNLVAGESGVYGFYISAVDGRTANEDKREWWQIVRNGVMTTTAVDSTPIEDGDTIELILSTY
jgi:hypothetical protein